MSKTKTTDDKDRKFVQVVVEKTGKTSLNRHTFKIVVNLGIFGVLATNFLKISK